MDNLVHLLQRRSDGYWGLLATAAGRVDSVEQCIEALRSRAIEFGCRGPSFSPSLVAQRVDSLAAFDTKRLVELCRSWKPPQQISLNLMDEAADFWGAAWSTAMRFLKKEGEPLEFGSGALPRQIQLERDVLHGPSTPPIQSFEALLIYAANEVHDYNDYRRLDRCTVQLSEAIGAGQMRQLVGSSRSWEDLKLKRLRMLLSRVELIGADAREWLHGVLREGWLALDGPPSATGGLLVLLNLVLKLEAPGGVPADIAEHFAKMLARTNDAASWAPFAYLLLGRGWECP